MDKKWNHRSYTGPVRFTNPDGSPLCNTTLRMKQVRHEFMFGCNCFFSVEYLNHETPPELDSFFRERLDKWLKLFNTATLPFYWNRFEPVQGQPRTKQVMTTANYLKSNGITLKGHPLCWHTLTAPWLLNMSNEDILNAQIERIYRDVSAFRGVIDMWDVINEVVIMPVFDIYDNGITRICKANGRIKTVKAMFDAVRQVNPNATLLINDFNTSQAYEILIEGLLEAGVSIDVIGIQSHQHQGYWGKEKLEAVLHRYERFGLPIHFTENTLLSGQLMPPHIVDLNDWQVDEWPTTPEYEERQMIQLKEMYETLFSHPLVEAIVNWDFADGAWLKAPSGLIRPDNSEKPSYRELHRLIHEEWQTDTEIHTNANGIADVTAFFGDYVVTGDNLSIPLQFKKSGVVI